MKIVYLIDSLETIQAGTEKQLSHLLHYFPSAGFDVHLVSLQKSPFLLHDAPHIFPQVNFSALNAKSDMSKSLLSLLHLFLLLKKEKPFLVHTFFPAANSFGILVARLAGIKNLISSRRDMGFNLSPTDIFLLKIADKYVSRIIVNAEKIKDYTAKTEHVPYKKIKVIHNGISLSSYNPGHERSVQDKPIIGIVANMNRQVKRVDLFIKAAAIIQKEIAHAEFWILGDGPLRQDLERLAADKSLNSHIRFWGRESEISKFLSQMTIGVITSDSEGLSNSIMEYMCAGLPVVATDVGGNPELVRQGLTGLLVPPNDEVSIANAILKLIKNPKEIERMGTNGRDVIRKEFSIEKMLRETSLVYKSLIDSKING